MIAPRDAAAPFPEIMAADGRCRAFDADAWQRILEAADRAVAHDDNAGFTTLLALSARWNSVSAAF